MNEGKIGNKVTNTQHRETNTENFTDKAKSVGERIDRIGPEKVTPEEERTMLLELFPVDPKNGSDAIYINTGLNRMLIQPQYGREFLTEEKERRLLVEVPGETDRSAFNRRAAILKYPHVLLPARKKISQTDWIKAIERVARHKGQKYFQGLATRVEYGPSKARAEQVATIKEDLLKGQRIALFGPFKIGKTSLFQSLSESLPLKSCIIEDLLTRSAVRDITLDVFKHQFLMAGIAQYLRSKYSMSLGRDEKHITESGLTPIEYLSRELEKRNDVVYIFLEEILGDIAYNRPDLLEYILRALQHPNIVLAISAGPNPKEKGDEETMELKKSLESFKPYYVRALTVEEVTEMIRSPLKDSAVRVTDGFLSKLHELSGGRPNEIKAVMDYLIRNEYSGRKIIYKEIDLENLIAQPLSDLQQINGEMRWALAEQIHTVHGCLNDAQRELLFKIGRNPKELVEAQNKQSLDYLENLTLISRDKITGEIKINGGLLKKAILESEMGLEDYKRMI